MKNFKNIKDSERIDNMPTIRKRDFIITIVIVVLFAIIGEILTYNIANNKYNKELASIESKASTTTIGSGSFVTSSDHNNELQAQETSSYNSGYNAGSSAMLPSSLVRVSATSGGDYTQYLTLGGLIVNSYYILSVSQYGDNPTSAFSSISGATVIADGGNSSWCWSSGNSHLYLIKATATSITLSIPNHNGGSSAIVSKLN